MTFQIPNKSSDLFVKKKNASERRLLTTTWRRGQPFWDYVWEAGVHGFESRTKPRMLMFAKVAGGQRVPPSIFSKLNSLPRFSAETKRFASIDGHFAPFSVTMRPTEVKKKLKKNSKLFWDFSKKKTFSPSLEGDLFVTLEKTIFELFYGSVCLFFQNFHFVKWYPLAFIADFGLRKSSSAN